MKLETALEARGWAWQDFRGRGGSRRYNLFLLDLWCRGVDFRQLARITLLTRSPPADSYRLAISYLFGSYQLTYGYRKAIDHGIG